MPFSALDRPAVSRALSQLVERPDDLVDAFLERSEVIELPAEGEAPGSRYFREEGLAVRLCREDRTWLASRDRLDGASFADAVRQVARVHPRAVAPPPEPLVAPWEPLGPAPELATFARLLDRALREKRVAFPYRMTLRRHRRDVQVLAPHLVPAPEREAFYSWSAELPANRLGGLTTELVEATADEIAGRFAEAFRCREALPPAPGTFTLVLGPAAAATLLHEAVAHALEADTLAIAGSPAAARGVRVSELELDVLDDPGGAPHAVRRRTDDEGTTITPRWLLRRGVVDQLLCDQRWGRKSAGLEAGSGRRASRHHLPGPRSTYLRLLPGEGTLEELLAQAGDGLYLPEAERGRLEPSTGSFMLAFPHGRRIRGGVLEDRVGPCALHSNVADLLSRIVAVGGRAVPAGAGWCAKGGQKLPVWAASPEMVLREVEITAGGGMA